KGEVAALLSGGWQGSAAEGFAQGWEQWHAGANDVLEALATMGRLLGTTGQNYELVDEDSARREWELGAGL
ncbi:MAG: WXG100 family type VII secretion target, partial [Sciscionella sp.]